MMKPFRLIALVLVALTLNSCSTVQTSQATITNQNVRRRIVGDDMIYAAGIADKTNQLVLQGQIHFYLITQGSKELASLLQLDPERLNTGTATDVTLTGGNKFEMTVVVEYTYELESLTSEETKIFKGLHSRSHFYKNKDGTGKIVALIVAKGEIYGSQKPPYGYMPMYQGLKVNLVTLDEQVSYKDTKMINKDFQLSLPVTFDLATLPFKRFFLASKTSR